MLKNTASKARFLFTGLSISTDVMKGRITETSPQVYARIGGVLYLIIIVMGFCSELFVRDKLVVSGDVTATANNIMASESLWRISIAGELILLVCGVALTLALLRAIGVYQNWKN